MTAVRMTLARILIRENADSHIVHLREQDGERELPILIGLNEAMAVERRLMGQKPPRPYTHELLATVIEQLGATIDRVVINDLRDHTFFARLVLKRDGQTVDIDARPSDAIALGVGGEVPFYVEEAVLDAVGDTSAE